LLPLLVWKRVVKMTEIGTVLVTYPDGFVSNVARGAS
jgi:hypothetical protein